MKTKLKGYTILEALLSMLLLSMIISVTYLFFNLLNKQFSLFEKENNQLIKYNLFDNIIRIDTYNSNHFIYNKSKLTLEFYNLPNINYRFESNYILRSKKGVTDTIYANLKRCIFLEQENDSRPELFLTLELLNETIETHYFLNINDAEIINQKYFNEN